jgi:quercetin dioxygenase-like cupin family protein
MSEWRLQQVYGTHQSLQSKIQPGDVVWIPPGEKHWHGATPTTAMTHIAIQEQLDGKAADSMEKVSEEQYGNQNSL